MWQKVSSFIGMTSVASLTTSPLVAEDAAPLAVFFAQQPGDYRSHFQPFADESESAFAKLLTEAEKDVYAAAWVDGVIVAFYMLRGWDAGYERPSFGLMVDHRHAGKGLAAFCLKAALVTCRLRGVKSCMLKVAPGNTVAKTIYKKAGFRYESQCPTTGHEVHVADWK
jgi:RimJ/RimL family protein N-acetyltransferase